MHCSWRTVCEMVQETVWRCSKGQGDSSHGQRRAERDTAEMDMERAEMDRA